MRAILVVGLVCFLFAIVYSMQLNPVQTTSDEQMYADPYAGWFTGGAWNTGWHGPGVAYGMGPATKACQCASQGKPYGSCGLK
jgi:hypothetical protein